VALPLLIPDLTTFLWWRDVVQVSDKIFGTLLGASDRLVIDSAEFEDPENDLVETDKLFVHDSCENVGISDLNWARLTFWRELLADFTTFQLTNRGSTNCTTSASIMLDQNASPQLWRRKLC